MNPILSLLLGAGAIYVGSNVVEHYAHPAPLSPLAPAPGSLPATHPAVLNSASNYGASVANSVLPGGSGVDTSSWTDVTDPTDTTVDHGDDGGDTGSGYGGDLAGAMSDGTTDDYDPGNMSDSSTSTPDTSSDDSSWTDSLTDWF